MRYVAPLALTAVVAATPLSVNAAGYDTPILYSAQHMGMGGAAIGYVDDPTAMFHNPAGLARSMGLSLMVNASLIMGSIRSAPDADLGDQTSEDIFAVAPLLGVSYKATDWFAFGVAFYPVASAGAEYNYVKNGEETKNATDVRFLELAPTIAFKLPGNVTLGASWRAISASLRREVTAGLKFDADMSGINLGGFRIGAQWSPIPELDVGVVFRNRTDTTMTDDDALVVLPDRRKAETEFTLPAKIAFGARVKLDPIAFALDLEYAFQSQNKNSAFRLDPELPDFIPTINNVFNWEDGITLRAGVEYGVDDRFFFRGGFIYDSQVSQEMYPSAFGTPPTSTMTMTAGFGMKCGDTWKLNFAVAHRLGQTVVERGNPDEGCIACAFDGNYKIAMTGLYVDFMWSFADL